MSRKKRSRKKGRANKGLTQSTSTGMQEPIKEICCRTQNRSCNLKIGLNWFNLPAFIRMMSSVQLGQNSMNGIPYCFIYTQITWFKR